MCAWYDAEEEYCATRMEAHWPGDKGCSIWIKYDDPEYLNMERIKIPKRYRRKERRFK